MVMAKRPVKPKEGPLPLREAQVLAGVTKLLTLLKNQGKLTFRRINVGGLVIRGILRKNSGQVGMADLMVFLPKGITLHWELKATDGHLSFEQTEWARELRQFGHEYFMIRSVEEAEAILAAKGVGHWSFASPRQSVLSVEADQ
jgi:hypothetical protein